MTVTTKNFSLYNTLVEKSYWDDEFRRYLKDFEDLMVSAGLVKSNIAGNLSWRDAEVQLQPHTSVSDKYTTPMYFDWNDELQNTTPVRLSFEFGYYAYSSNIAYARIPIVVTTIGIVNDNNDISTNQHRFTSSSKYNISTSATVSSSSFYTSNSTSFIINKPGFLAVSLNMNDYIYSGKLGGQSFVYFVIERFDNDINLFSGRGGGTSSLLYTMLLNEYETNPLAKIGHIIYGTSNSAYNNNKLVTYPVMLINRDKQIKQSNNLFLAKASALGDNKVVSLTIDGESASFIASYNSSHSVTTNNNILLLRYE